MRDASDGRFAPDHLRCEYDTNPLGLDERRPRLSWWIHDPSTPRGAVQSSYRILVASSEADLGADRGDVWDSGRVESARSVFVAYAGPELRPRARYHWKVRFWNAAGEMSDWSHPAWWEMGLLDETWTAAWIGSHLVGGRETGAPAPYLRKRFTLADRPAAARLHITALGLYEASINGARVGDLVFPPGWTDYRTRVMVQTYDVTDHLVAGENVLGAILGDGWYCGHVGPMRRQFYGDRPLLRARLDIRHADGRTEMIDTDGSWRTSAGPILANDMLMGETYDARFEMPGWDEAGFDDAAWLPVVVFEDQPAKLTGTLGPRARAIETIAAKTVTQPKRGVYVFDFGQNLVGRVRIRLRGSRGETATLRHAEMLNADGTLYTENLRGAKATDRYTFAADGEITWEPLFTFHGFRYVELTGCRGVTWDAAGMTPTAEPSPDCATAVVLHADMPPTGAFACSHNLVNQLQHNIVWGQKGNFLEVPTDCPQRDERLGWTGDIQVFLATACFNMDVAGFMAKWLIDLADAQHDSGAYPIIAPDILNSPANGSAAWADAGVICPWLLYQRYGDERVLERHYEAMVRFVEYLRAEAGHSHIRPKGGFGDWLSIGAYTPLDVIGTAYFAHSADLLSRIADVLGKADDAATYRGVFEKVRGAFCREFVTDTGRIIGDSQTAYVLALRFDLLPEALRPAALTHLLDDIDHGRSTDWPYPERNGRISTGFIGCKHINLALTEAGRADVAYKLLTNEAYPSWLFPVLNGATTIWERWDGWTPQGGFQTPQMNSFNHYAFGAIGEWLYATVAGLDVDPDGPGFRRIVICPIPGGGLTHAEGSLQTPYGLARCAWRLRSDRFTMEVTIPPNTTATVHLPAASLAEVTESGAPVEQAPGLSRVGIADGVVVCHAGSGSYTFTAAV